MKTLIVFYSRSGNTRKVAQAIAAKLGADLEEIIDPKDRSGALGWMAAGKDATFKSATPIKPVEKDPGLYDRVIVGTPVWAFTMASPVRTYLTQHGKGIKQAAFFCTLGGSGDKRTFEDMQGLCGKEPLATAAILEKDIKKDSFGPAIETFVQKLS